MENSCKHKWNGDTIMYSSKGKRITPYTYIRWVSFTSEFRGELIMDHHEDILDPIVSAVCTCSKCGTEFRPLHEDFLPTEKAQNV